MKIVKSLYTLPLMLLLLAGCAKFVETETPDSFNDDNYWTSEANVRTFNWEFYNLFVGFGTGTTADFYFSTFADDQASSSFQNFAVSAAATNGAWDFGFVRKANIMLSRVDRVPMSDEAKNHWKGIARFFRALDYFNKVKTFGDVPWYSRQLDISDTTEMYKPRTPRKEVMDSVLADLNFAVANIRTADLDNTVNRNVALALKSRICLYEGTYRKYHTELSLPDADKYLQEAKSASEALMTGTYVINPLVADKDHKWANAIYNSMDLAGNKEVLLYKKYVAGALTHSVIGYTNSSTIMNGVSKSAVDAFVATDGLPIGLSPLYQGDDNIQKTTANRDRRLLVTVDTFLAYKGALVNGLSSSTGYRPAKFLQPASQQLAPNNETDAPIFYYSEVLLNYAEAAAELDQMGKYTFTQADLDKSVNLLRTRAGVAKLEVTAAKQTAIAGTPFVDPKKDADVPSLIWEIRRERRVELMMDGFRNIDIMRWKKGNYLGTATNPDAFLGAKVPANPSITRDANGYIMPYPASSTRTFIDPKHYLTAIPTGQIALYPAGVLKQNTGWE